MVPLTIDDLAAEGAALGLSLPRDQLQRLLPEVERLREAARLLRELPLQSDDEPSTRFSPV